MDSSLRLLLLMVGIVFIAVVLWDSFRRTRFDAKRRAALVDNHKALQGVSVDLNASVHLNTEDLPPNSATSNQVPAYRVKKASTGRTSAESLEFEQSMSLPPTDDDDQASFYRHDSGTSSASHYRAQEDFSAIDLSAVDSEPEILPSFQLQSPPAAPHAKDVEPDSRTRKRHAIPFHAALSSPDTSADPFTAGAVTETTIEEKFADASVNTQVATEFSSQEEHLVVFHVRGKNGLTLKGDRLHQLFEELGLEFGEMNIFHYFASAEHTNLRAIKQPVFSVANSHEPGTFPDAGLDAFETDGLSFFMRLPNPIDGDKAFDQLLGTVGRIAQGIDGEVCDERRQLLTKQSAGRARDIALRYCVNDPNHVLASRH